MYEGSDRLRVEKMGGLIFPPWEKLEERGGRVYGVAYVLVEVSWDVLEDEVEDAA